LGTGGVALAEELATHVEDSPMAPAPLASPAPEPDVGSLLESIRNRQEQLVQREIEIAERKLELNFVEQRIAQQLSVLKQAEQKLADTLAIADSAAENDLKQLTEVYEKMKAKNAAEIFGTMEISFAAGFLSRMKPESAAGILSEMPPNAAYFISVVMAGKNANAPTE
jgi:flagellar motility protein MotE (MotC chaperone)